LIRPFALGFLVCLLLSGCESDVDGPRSDAPATRIVTLAPHLTELVYTAGAGDRLAGVVEYSDFPVAALELPRIGDSFRLDYEAIAVIGPDLILAWTSGTPADVRDRLHALGYRVVSLDATTLVDVAAQILDIGALAGTSDAAAVAAANYTRRLDELRARYRDADVVRVFYQISAQPLFTVTGRHVISEAIETCGGENVFVDLDGLSPAVSLESVVVAAPDVIVAGSDMLSSEAVAELTAQWAEWTSIPAVRQGMVFVVEADRMHRSTTRILDAVEELCGYLDLARIDAAGHP